LHVRLAFPTDRISGVLADTARDVAAEHPPFAVIDIAIPARSNEPPFGFPGDDLERLAELGETLVTLDRQQATRAAGVVGVSEPGAP